MTSEGLQGRVDRPETVSDARIEHCNKWFYCGNCDIEYGDPYAEIHDGQVVGSCGECGNTHTKPVETALEVRTVRQKRRDENQQITEWSQ